MHSVFLVYNTHTIRLMWNLQVCSSLKFNSIFFFSRWHMSSGAYWRTILALLQERISDLLMGAMTRPIWRKWLLLFIASLKGYISSTQVCRESEKFCFLTQNFLFYWSLWPFLIFWLKLKNMHLIWQEASKSKNGKAPHAAWCNYDDLNEYFWLDHRFFFLLFRNIR